MHDCVVSHFLMYMCTYMCMLVHACVCNAYMYVCSTLLSLHSTIRKWNIHSGQCLREIYGHEAYIYRYVRTHVCMYVYVCVCYYECCECSKACHNYKSSVQTFQAIAISYRLLCFSSLCCVCCSPGFINVHHGVEELLYHSFLWQ